ncbi:putative protein N(5)-glutamine methyltransferase [Streptomyces sp. NPDC050560]|uniref:putative protein N(5)-glutamine methyltransferase n=1 Tax=Streptomyces sp. NPDC050560 TaxID=3365630 RepID=UPI0037AC6509
MSVASSPQHPSSGEPSPAASPAPGSRPAPLSESAVVAALRAAGCVFAEDEARLLMAAAASPGPPDGGLEALVARRVAGLPLEQVVGWAEFCGLRIALEPGVFVPRRRTEFLATRALELAPPRPVAVDLCCGSGAVAAVLAARLDLAELHAADVDPAAVRCARRNVPPPGAVHEGDLFAALPARLRGTVGVLCANVPYVPSGDIALLPQEARVHEPLVALDGGGDGLRVLRRVTAGAAGWLAPGGVLLIETGEHQVAAAVEAFARGGLDTRVEECAELGATVVAGVRAR